MSEQDKKEKPTDLWHKNAEDHGRMETQLATIKTQVDGLNQRVGKVEDGPTELRTELIGTIDDVRPESKGGLDKTNTRIDDLRTGTKQGFEKTIARIDDLRTEMKQGFEKTNARIDDLRTEMKQGFEKTTEKLEEFRNEMYTFMDKFRTETKERDEKQRIEARNGRRWIVGTIIATISVATAVIGLVIGL